MNTTTPFKLAAIDLDGTLLASDKSISPANFEAVQRLQEAGVTVVIASGREHLNCIRYHRQLGLTGPIVSFQGGYVKHPDSGEVILASLLPEDLTSEILRQAIEFDTTVLFGSESG